LTEADLRHAFDGTPRVAFRRAESGTAFQGGLFTFAHVRCMLYAVLFRVRGQLLASKEELLSNLGPKLNQGAVKPIGSDHSRSRLHATAIKNRKPPELTEDRSKCERHCLGIGSLRFEVCFHSGRKSAYMEGQLTIRGVCYDKSPALALWAVRPFGIYTSGLIQLVCERGLQG
jgi:hypothetical protein